MTTATKAPRAPRSYHKPRPGPVATIADAPANLPGIIFTKASITAFVPADAAPAVYRIYDADDRLLYLGASAKLRDRLLTHARDPRMIDGATVRIEYVRNTTAMARREREGNAAEKSVIHSGPARRHHRWKTRDVKHAA